MARIYLFLLTPLLLFMQSPVLGIDLEADAPLLELMWQVHIEYDSTTGPHVNVLTNAFASGEDAFPLVVLPLQRYQETMTESHGLLRHSDIWPVVFGPDGRVHHSAPRWVPGNAVTGGWGQELTMLDLPSRRLDLPRIRTIPSDLLTEEERLSPLTHLYSSPRGGLHIVRGHGRVIVHSTGAPPWVHPHWIENAVFEPNSDRCLVLRRAGRDSSRVSVLGPEGIAFDKTVAGSILEYLGFTADGRAIVVGLREIPSLGRNRTREASFDIASGTTRPIMSHPKGWLSGDGRTLIVTADSLTELYSYRNPDVAEQLWSIPFEAYFLHTPLNVDGSYVGLYRKIQGSRSDREIIVISRSGRVVARAPKAERIGVSHAIFFVGRDYLLEGWVPHFMAGSRIRITELKLYRVPPPPKDLH